jgi:anti-sigma factor RsiW
MHAHEAPEKAKKALQRPVGEVGSEEKKIVSVLDLSLLVAAMFRSLLSSFSSLSLQAARSQTYTPTFQQVRNRGSLAPRRTKFRKAHKGRVPVRTGGSTKGTTVTIGQFGLRLLDGAR